MDVRNIFFSCKRMSPNCVHESMDDEIRIATGIFCLAQDSRTDLHSMIHQITNHFDKVIPSIIQAPT